MNKEFKKQNADLLIYNATILTMDENLTIIPNGVVVVKENKIIDIGSNAISGLYNSQKRIDAEQNIVMPGFVNCHNHIPMIAFRGLGEEGVKNRLEDYFFPLEKNLLNADLVHKATIHGCINMALNGITTYADMYYFTMEMSEATKQIGLRAFLGETVIGFPVADAPKPYGGLKYALEFIEHYKNDELITSTFAPHAPYTVSKDVLSEIKHYSLELNVPVHIHIAEFKDEVNSIKDNTKKLSVAKYLESFGFLTNKTILAHCNYCDAEDIDIIKQSDAGVSHNAISNSKGATGVCDAYQMYNKNVRLGLGTDGPMGANQLDPFAVMDTTSKVQRVKYMDDTIMNPKDIVWLATMGGARALHMEDKLGSLKTGKLADIVIIDTKSPNMFPLYDIYASLVFQANPTNILTTIVNGKVIVENRKLLTYNMEQNHKDMMIIEKETKEFLNKNTFFK